MTGRRRAGWRVVALACALAWGTSGCEDPPADDGLEAALPSTERLLFSFPTPEGVRAEEGALGMARAPLTSTPGEPSDLYQISRQTQREVNRALRELLAPLRQIVGHARPVRQADGGRLWRVSPRSDPDEHALLIRREEDGHFEFSAWSRAHEPATARWRFRLYGTTTPSGHGDARGAVWVNLDNDRQDRTRGKVLAFWEQIGGRREVSVALYSATPDAGELSARTRGYLFVDGPAGGLMLYGPELMNVHADPDKGAPERVTLLSRWGPDGVGRTDVTARGGDISTAGLAARVRTECWAPPGFAVTYTALHSLRRPGGELELITASEDPDYGQDPCGGLEVELAVPPGLVDEPLAPRLPADLTPAR